MTGISSLSNKHMLTSQQFRGAAGCGSRAGTPSHIPVDTQFICMGEAAVVCCYCCHGLCSSWGHLTFLPVLTWRLGQWDHPCMPKDDPALEYLAFAAMAAGRNCVQGCVGVPSLISPNSCWAAIAWGHFSLIPHSVTSL